MPKKDGFYAQIGLRFSTSELDAITELRNQYIYQKDIDIIPISSFIHLVMVYASLASEETFKLLLAEGHREQTRIAFEDANRELSSLETQNLPEDT